MKFVNSICFVSAVVLLGCAFSGCTTTTRRFSAYEARQTITGFSEEDINDTVRRAVESIYIHARIKLQPGANRAVLVVQEITNDTLSRGRDAGALAEALSMSLREMLTNGGKVVVYNKEVAQYATVKVSPQYMLSGRLTQRNLRQDNGDIQIEYNLNLQLVDLQTGLEFWQKRVHVGKLADVSNLM